jgi:polyhydroxyalkanoate synthesis repressor PhaR
MVTIKRYSNRKLYDINNRQYITLDEIRELVRQDEEVRIIDHKTGSDLTSTILTQIIFEYEKKTGGLLPRTVLRHMIKAGEGTLRGLHGGVRAFLDPRQYVDASIQGRLRILVAEKKLTEIEGDRLEELLLSPYLAKATEPILEMLDQAQQLPPNMISKDEVIRLIEQVEDLEQQIDEIQSAAQINKQE